MNLSMKKTIAGIGLSVGLGTAIGAEPTLLLIGGALNENADIISRFVNLSGGNTGAIGVITAGSYPYDLDCQQYGTSTSGGCNDPTVSNSKMNANYYVDLFQSYGIDAYWIPVDAATINNANDPAVVNLIANATGLFFSGGDQSRYLESFIHNGQDSAAMTKIRQQYNSGNAVIAGSSAGTAVMGDVMITGGSSYNALRYGAYQLGTEVDPDDLTYTQPGFALFNYGLIDTHFSARGRAGRIVELAYDRNIDTAWGIDEETALLIVGANSTAADGEVIGVGGVHRFDLSQAYTGSSNSYELYNVSWTHGTDQDLIDLNTGLLSNTRAQPSASGRASTSRDVFSSASPREMIDMGISLALSGDRSVIGQTRERSPRYAVRLSKSADFYAFGSSNTSFDGMRLDMYNKSVSPVSLP